MEDGADFAGIALTDPLYFVTDQTDQQTSRDKYDSQRTWHQCLANSASRASPCGQLCPSKGAHCHLMTCLGISRR